MAKEQKDTKAKQPESERVRITLRAFDKHPLEMLVRQILETIERTGGDIAGPIPLPTRKKRFTLVRSPHIDKRSMEYFEIRVHKRLIDIVRPSASTIEALAHINAPSGVDVSVKL